MATVFKRGGKGNRGGTWYVQWFDHLGRRRSKSARTTDKATAERIAGKLESDAALRREGVIDPRQEMMATEARRPVEELLKQFVAKLRAAGRNAKHVATTEKTIRTIFEFAEMVYLADLNCDGINRYAVKLVDEGKSARTVQAHLGAVKAFSRWLVQTQKIAFDPLVAVRKPNPKSDRRRIRRMLLPEEWGWLDMATRRAPVSHGMSGDERAKLYRTAIESALRSGELRSLTRGHLYHRESSPFLVCHSADTKNAKAARQYISHELAQDLATLAATKSPKARLFGMPDESDVAGMLRADLALARANWLQAAKDDPAEYSRREASDFLADTNHSGEHFDFHCLRHTCGAWLAMQGSHPKAIQAVMRHSSITLTMDTYGHLFPGQEAETVARLEGLLNPPLAPLKATGTLGESTLNPFEQRAAKAQQLGCEITLFDAGGCESAQIQPLQPGLTETVVVTRDSDGMRRGAPPVKSASRWTRTINPLIKSPHALCENSENCEEMEPSAAYAQLFQQDYDSFRLAKLILEWPGLSEAKRAAILSIIAEPDSIVKG